MANHDLDCRGELCPLPLLRTRKLLATVADGEHISVLTTDPLAALDIEACCARDGHRYLGATSQGGHEIVRLRKGLASA